MSVVYPLCKKMLLNRGITANIARVVRRCEGRLTPYTVAAPIPLSAVNRALSRLRTTPHSTRGFAKVPHHPLEDEERFLEAQASRVAGPNRSWRRSGPGNAAEAFASARHLDPEGDTSPPAPPPLLTGNFCY